MLCVGWEGGTLLEWLLPLVGMSFGFDALACAVNNSTGISGAAVYFLLFDVFSWSLFRVGTLLNCWFFVERISLDLQGLADVSTGFMRSC